MNPPQLEPTAAAPPAPSTARRAGPKPLTYGRKGLTEVAFLWYFVAVPFLALLVESSGKRN